MLERFLYHDAAERERLLDLSLRLRPAYAMAVLVMVIPAVLGIPVFGFAATVPLIVGAAGYVALNLRLPHVRHPERYLLASCALGLLSTLVSIWLADGPKEYLFAMPVVPMLGMAPIFAKRVSVAAGLLAAVGIVIVGVGSYGPQVQAMPPILILPILLVLVTVFGSIASRNAEDVGRGTAMVDPLTGLLNRTALGSRTTELQLHAAATTDRVGLILCDLDHFAAVNASHGEAHGDAVLVEVAGRLRTELGTAGTIYRFDGESFVVLLQSATACTARQWAERLREAVCFAPVLGVDVTASFGVALSDPAVGFGLRPLFVEADGALRRAKTGGRDQVCVASEADPAQARPAQPLGESVLTTHRATDVAPSVVGALHAPHDDGFGEDWELRLPVEAKNDGTWLVADAVERAHVIDLLQRSAKDSQVNSALVLVALLVSGFWLGWWMVLPPVVAGLFWRVCTTRIPNARRPEFAALGGILLITTAASVGATLATAPALFALPLGALAIFGACAGFNRHGAVVIAGSAMLSVVAAAFVIDASTVLATPIVVAFPLALIVANAILGAAMGRTAREHRVASITDALTGSLNRVALEARIPQLAQDAATSAAPTTLAVVAVDDFAKVVDVFGDDAGDVVLAEVSSRLRGSLRAFDSVYRVAGESFVIVLTGMAESDAREIAERARRAVGQAPVDGIGVTVSVGIATAQAGEPLDFDGCLALAETHLHAARRGGRDRVVDGRPPAAPRRLIAA